MKNSITLTATITYTLFAVAQIINASLMGMNCPSLYWLMEDVALGLGTVYDTLMYTLLFVSIVLFCYGIYKTQVVAKLPTWMRVFTIGLAVFYLGTIICSAIYGVTICGWRYCGIYVGWRIVLYSCSILWIWLYATRPQTQSISKSSVKWMCFVPFIITGIVVIMGIVAGVYLLAKSHVLGLRTGLICNWLMYILPAWLLCFIAGNSIRTSK